jgi:hypothetical protein
MSKFNYQIRNKTRLCNSKIKTQELKIRTQEVQNTCEMNIYYVNICKHENNMTRLWCKIVPNIGVEQIEGNEGTYFYLYPFGVQGSFYVCIE